MKNENNNTVIIAGVEDVPKGSSLPEVGKDTAPFQLEKNYIIRTVTHTYTGKLVWMSEKELVLDTCAWIADSGRWHNAIKDGTLDEVEPMGDGVIIGRGAIVDATPWEHALPASQR